MYETIDALFTGICDAIREKDGTTARIRHQEIPARISAISGTDDSNIYVIDQPQDYFYLVSPQDSQASVISYINTKDQRIYARFGKSYSIAVKGYDSAIFALYKQVNAKNFSKIIINCAVGSDGGGITTKVYVKIADTIPDAVPGENYDFSDWYLIKSTRDVADYQTEETIEISLDNFESKSGNLYIGLYHGEESRNNTSLINLSSIKLQNSVLVE